jgi:hypothetical protein
MQALTVLPDGTSLQSQQQDSMCQPGFSAAEHQVKQHNTVCLEQNC